MMKPNAHATHKAHLNEDIRHHARRPLLPRALAPIAVVLVLAAMLPGCIFALARSREQSRRAACLSNCKQIMLALKQYSQDFLETYPWGVGAKKPEDAWRDLGFLFPNYNSGFKSFFCPSADDKPYKLDKDPFEPFEAGDELTKVISYAYGMNASSGQTVPWDENARSTVRLLADKKAGIELKDKDARLANHRDDGRNVAYHDGHVKWAAGTKALDPDPDDDDVGDPEAQGAQGAPDYTKFWSDPPWYREGMDNAVAQVAPDTQ